MGDERPRSDRLAWRALSPDNAARREYEQLEAQLAAACAERPRGRREARAGCNYLYHLVRTLVELGQPGGAVRWPLPVDLPPSKLAACTPGEFSAAWHALCAASRWGPAFRREVRTLLGRALLLLDRRLAHLVSPP